MFDATHGVVKLEPWQALARVLSLFHFAPRAGPIRRPLRVLQESLRAL